MTKLPGLFECHRLRAKISERQCKINREGYRSRGINIPSITSCQGCTGLGESVQVSAPTEIPTMTTNKKVYICITPGCGRKQQKNKLCYLCNKAAEAAKHGSHLDDTPVIHDVNNLDVKPAVKTVASDNKLSETTTADHIVEEDELAKPLHFCTADMRCHACGLPAGPDTQSTTAWEDVTCPNCLLWKPSDVADTDVVDIAACLKEEQDADRWNGVCGLALPEPSGVPKLPMSEAAFNEFTEMLYQSACGDDTEALAQAPGPGYQDGLQISPTASPPPQEQVTAWLGLSSPLAALVVTPEPSVPPLPDTAIVLDLGPMYETLVDRGVGIVTILELLDALFISNTYRLIRHAAD